MLMISIHNQKWINKMMKMVWAVRPSGFPDKHTNRPFVGTPSCPSFPSDGWVVDVRSRWFGQPLGRTEALIPDDTLRLQRDWIACPPFPLLVLCGEGILRILRI